MEKNTWEQVKDLLRLKLSPEAFHNWLERSVFLSLAGGVLRVAVPDEATREWLETEYSAIVGAATRELRLPVTQISYEAASGLDLESQRTQPAGLDSGILRYAPRPLELNPKLTFDSFVVGSCNQFAHAAARSVAQRPARSYNPLFIYGGTGMGKTHLVHATGSALKQSFSKLRIVYTTGDRFTNEMVSSIKSGSMDSFRELYRSADVLLVDDVHMIGGKERTQEEFFHTFNELHEHQKQIVMTSDSLPKQIPNLTDRLRSRFEWGLMVDVQPPDLETKMAILDRKAEMEGIVLPEDVRVYIASKTKSNVRELEGALVKLIAYSSVTNTPITQAMAQQVLKPLIPVLERRVTIEGVIKAVGERFSLPPNQLKQKTNAHAIARPRQIAMYCAKELTGASLPEIGRHFGGKHHTTVLHSIRRIEELRQTDPDLNRIIQSIIDSFQ